ncbi:MAG: ATP-binding protein, partial [Oscillibacter sp.]|nr:ATP-binding protein [Oscillibacter sp.]
TLVLDTADWAEMLCARCVCARKRVEGIEDFGYGKGYVYLAEEFGRLLNLLSEIVDRGIGVVLTAHAKMRKFEQPDEMGAYDRWEMKLQPKTAAIVKEWTDVLLFANYKTYAVAVDDKGKKYKAQGGARVMYTSHHPCWDAKNRIGLPDEMPLDYAQLAPYIGTAAPSPAPPAPSAARTAAAPVQAQPAPTEQARKEPPPTNQNVADRDMYFYYPESNSYWMIHKGEPLPENIDASEEISKEQYDAGIADGSEPYQNPIPDPENPNGFPPAVPVESKRQDAGHQAKMAGSNPQTGRFFSPRCAADETVTFDPDRGYIGLDGRPLKDALQEFYALMEADHVALAEVQAAIARKGYFPEGTPLGNMPDDFIHGVLIGAWEKVKAVVEEIRGELPF